MPQRVRKYSVWWCGGSEYVSDFRSAVKLARGRSARRFARGECQTAQVYRATRAKNQGRGAVSLKMLVRCRDKVCEVFR